MTTRRQLQMLQQVHCTFLKSLLISWTTQCVLKVFVHFSASQANPKPQRQRSQYCNLLKRPLRILQNILKKSEQMCNETMILNNTRRQNLRISVIPATSIATVMQVIPFPKACLTIKLAWVFNLKKNSDHHFFLHTSFTNHQQYGFGVVRTSPTISCFYILFPFIYSLSSHYV